jgi:hypothetical protein
VLVVAEGLPDALIASQAGFAAVGVLGSSYPDSRIADQVASRSREAGLTVAVCFDSDLHGAGATGASRLMSLLDERDVTVTNIEPPEGMDLSDWAATDPSWRAPFDALGALVESAAPSGLAPAEPDVSFDLIL